MTARALPNAATAAALLEELVSHRSVVGPRPVDRPLVLYGAGKLGHLASELFQRLGIPVAYALDRSVGAGEARLGVVPVRHPEAASEVDRKSHLVAVCIVNASYEPIRAYLAAMGWRHILPVYDVSEAYEHRLPMGNGWFADHPADEDIGNISRVLSGWSDDWSRAAHLQFLAWRLHRWEWQFQDAPVCVDDRYFIESVRRALGRRECFLDAGAHRGTVIARWLDLVKSRFDEILAVEADHENVMHLKQWIAGLPGPVQGRIRVRDSALAAEDGRRCYSHGMNLASKIVKQAEGTVNAMRLDDLNFPVTYGKIHLEGGELDALRGGVRTLQRYRPVLAVTVYHNQDGFWRTPKFLMDALSDYQFLMRLHAWCGTGCVVYAIPRERWRVA
jgi:FkbM family methyltransferase